jgi:hypothetical protein
MVVGTGRERDPQPFGRQAEVAFVALMGVLLLLSWTAAAAVGLAAEIFGGGWVWPGGASEVLTEVGALCSGRPAQGFTPALAARLPGPRTVYGCVGASEVLVLGLLLWVGVLVSQYRRPGDARRGMATSYEAAQVLGVRRLRSARGVIRPDLPRLPRWWAGAVGRARAAVGTSSEGARR